MEKRGLKLALDYLNSFYPGEMVPDDLHKKIGATIKVDTLAHSLRRAHREGKVAVVYKKDNSGVNIAHYRAMRDGVNATEHKPDLVHRSKVQPKVEPKKTGAKFPAVFFFELADKLGKFSPYYTSQAALEMAVPSGANFHIYTGSHEKPERIYGGHKL